MFTWQVPEFTWKPAKQSPEPELTHSQSAEREEVRSLPVSMWGVRATRWQPKGWALWSWAESYRVYEVVEDARLACVHLTQCPTILASPSSTSHMMASNPLCLSKPGGRQGKEGVISLNLSPKSGAQVSYLAPSILCTAQVSAAILFPASLAQSPVLTQ